MAETATLPSPRTAPAARGVRRRKRRSTPQQLIAWFGTGRGEALLLALLFAFSVAVRLPYLQLLPHFTDEVVEVSYSMAIARGEDFPLTAKDTYFGPIHYYILAGFIRLFGPSVALPRLVIMVFGALAVLATYLLGRTLAGRGAGFLGAALLATSPQHILINSHVAWQNSTMPLYSTLCLCAFVRAVQVLRRPGPPLGERAARRTFAVSLVLAGLLFGCTLQTHPGAVVLMPALGLAFLYALWSRRAWSALRSPWPYAAVLTALVAYSPILIFNVMNKLNGLRRVVYQRDYAYETNPTWETYRDNFWNLGLQFLRMISDPTRIPPQPRDYLTSPYLLLTAGLCLAGLVLLARRQEPLPLLLLIATQLIMPRFLRAYGTQSYYVMVFARYVTYLLPLFYIAIAVALLALLSAVLRRLPPPRSIALGRRGISLDPPRALTVAVTVALVGYLVLYPLWPLVRFYRETLPNDQDNISYAETISTLKALRGARTPVLIDEFMLKVFNKEGIASFDVITYMMQVEGIPYRVIEDPRAEFPRLIPTLDPRDEEALPLLITIRDRCWPTRETIPLQRVSARFRLHGFYPDLPSYYAIYRYVPAPQPAGCYGPEGAQPGD